MTSEPVPDGIFESFRRAEMFIADSRPLDALAALSPVLESMPDDVSVQLLAGRAYLNSAQLQRAQESFEWVVGRDPPTTTRGSRSGRHCNARASSPRPTRS